MIRCMKCMEFFSKENMVCPHCGKLAGAPPENPFYIHPGTCIRGRYIIGTVIGHGGFGITYSAWDEMFGIHVAVKEYFPKAFVTRFPGSTEVQLYSDVKAEKYYAGLGCFLNEARQIAAFSGNPNIVQVFDSFEANNTAYIVMEFLDGVSLNDYMKHWDGPMPVEESLEICISICDALTELHNHRIIHRDVTPPNIFLCVDKRIKLIDFGNARISDEENDYSRIVNGTFGYAPPEQYLSMSRQSSWTDTYSLCAVLYRLVTGQRPMNSHERMTSDMLASPMRLNPQIDEMLDRVIMKGLALNYENRFRTAEELKNALLECQPYKSPSEVQPQTEKRLPVEWMIGAAVIAAAVISAAIGLMF